MGYVYQADVYCDDCGGKIRQSIIDQGTAPADLDNESSYDSGDFPKVADVENEEADSPQHCAECHVFLENPLTSDGYTYVQDTLNRAGEKLSEVEQEWARFYSFEYLKNDYDCAGEWLESYLDNLAKGTDGPRSAELVSVARDLASKLDSDTIQDLFQSQMDDDDYFKESGWYSSEAF